MGVLSKQPRIDFNCDLPYGYTKNELYDRRLKSYEDEIKSIEKLIESTKSQNHLSLQETLDRGLNFGDDLLRGHARADKIRETLLLLDRLYRPRTSIQITINEKQLAACATLIYGEKTLKKYLNEILEYNGWTDITPGFVLQAPRRLGKSESTAYMLCALLFGLDMKLVFGIFTPKKTQADKNSGLLATVRNLILILIPNVKFTKDNEMNVEFHYNGYIKRIRGFTQQKLVVLIGKSFLFSFRL